MAQSLDRLLLAHNAANPKQPIGHESGQLGRNLMESTGWTSVGLAPEDLASFGGLPADSICWKFNRPDAIDGIIGGYKLSPAIHETDLAGPVAYARRATTFGAASSWLRRASSHRPS